MLYYLFVVAVQRVCIYMWLTVKSIVEWCSVWWKRVLFKWNRKSQSLSIEKNYFKIKSFILKTRIADAFGENENYWFLITA